MQIRYYPNRETPRPRTGARFFGAVKIKPGASIELSDEAYKMISNIPTYQRLVDESVIEEIVTKKTTRRTRNAKKVAETKAELKKEEETKTEPKKEEETKDEPKKEEPQEP